MMLVVTVSRTSAWSAPDGFPPVELPAMIEFTTVSEPSPWMPPPPWVDEFPLIVELPIVSVPLE